MSSFSKVLRKSTEFENLSQCIERHALPAGVTGLSALNKAHVIHAISEENNKKILVLVPDDATAVRMCEDLQLFSGTDDALYYPVRDFAILSTQGYSLEYEQMRLQVLSRMIRGDYKIIVAPASAAIQSTMPKSALQGRNIKLTIGTEISPETLVQSLLSAGYTRTQMVDGTGQFSVRGGILDVYAPIHKNPMRIEFWGDEIDSLAYFDIESQRRIENIQKINITPAREVLFDSPQSLKEKLEALYEKISPKNEKGRQNIMADIERIDTEIRVLSPDRYLNLAYPVQETLFDYIAEDTVLFVSDSARVREQVKGNNKIMAEELKSFFESGILVEDLGDYQLSWSALKGKYEDLGAVYLDTFARGTLETKTKALIAFNARQNSQWSGQLSYLIEDLEPAIRAGYTCVVMAGTSKNAKLLTEDLKKTNLPATFYDETPETFTPKAVSVLPGGFSAGMEYPKEGFLLISQGKSGKTRRKGVAKYKRKSKKEAFNSLEELEKGDYVVHAMYGIGLFDGIEKIEAGGITKDYIKIKYAKEDVLYVPVTQLDIISKYIGANKEVRRVKLNRLGSSEWKNTRKRVSAAVKEMADELIKLYAERASIQGHAFMQDTDMQSDFESRFEYEETQDQIQSSHEIKKDMEKTYPMDRLLCGDVGFGKTEVALRAAFKCIVEGKQCAFLVPTTILAFQHYQTILQRFEGFPVDIEMISRFRTPAQQKEILKRLRRGNVDIIVGTHRLLSKDIKFKDLGLIIVDEEQRFGVAQKEKLKELFKEVDVLTLSATPIPRTLNMAMSGIRDMSILEQAPDDRRPVQTYVIEHDWEMVAAAITKELKRSGQVYYLHNRVESIHRTAAKIAKLVPNANIGIAHGKMSEEELSEVWRQLVSAEIDILVCTTIIETGVDVPNVNTLIIENADRMGLAQLHQIRGRVGRSARRAYAYLTFHRGKVLSQEATHRLEAIREYTEFGSGFKIAMRDLEIRGAGNLLGAQQHGHMEAVGYDMYMRLLEQAVKVAKGENLALENEEKTLIDLQVEAHIPEDYIESVPQRLAIYKRIADIQNGEDALDVMDELIDRFGEPPASVQGLIDVALLRGRAAKQHIYEVTQRGQRLLLYSNQIDMRQISKLAKILPRKMAVNASDKPYISIQVQNEKEGMRVLDEVLTLMDEITKVQAEKA